MGWERKRGKLLDLNKLLQGYFDSFPLKIGDLSILPQVRFVITLDSDTELPRGTAHRMIGTLAHPLNQAVIDPEKGTVVAGYGILQPRVGVSVQSTARSRLAAIYAGEPGSTFTRARFRTRIKICSKRAASRERGFTKWPWSIAFWIGDSPAMLS